MKKPSTIKDYFSKLSPESKSSWLKNEEWSICLWWTKDWKMILEWLHVFCIKWIVTWTSTKPTCPLWKQTITNNYVLVANGDKHEIESSGFDWSLFPDEVWKQAKFIKVRGDDMNMDISG